MTAFIISPLFAVPIYTDYTGIEIERGSTKKAAQRKEDHGKQSVTPMGKIDSRSIPYTLFFNENQ